jgi:hypothetical protein
MASFHAIAVTALTLQGLLKGAWPPMPKTGTWQEDLNLQPKFELVGAKELAATPGFEGISIYLHRVAFNTTRRNLPPRTAADSKRFRSPTPVDAHFLMTAWAAKPETQQSLLGWAVRTLQDAPVLPAGLLNAFAGNRGEVFRAGEAVELVGEVLTATDQVSLWEVAKANQQPSVSYIARMLFLDSEQPLETGPLVQTRVLREGQIVTP